MSAPTSGRPWAWINAWSDGTPTYGGELETVEILRSTAGGQPINWVMLVDTLNLLVRRYERPDGVTLTQVFIHERLVAK